MADFHASLESTSKSRIFKIVTRCQNWGVSIIFHYVQATSELKKFRQDHGQMGGSIPQQTCNTHLTSLKSGNEMIVWSNVNALKNIGWGVNHLSTFDADLRNVSFALISFMGFPAILSTLQPFQMCIYNRK